MKALCFGSLNIDYTYKVPHFVSRGETLSSTALEVFSGGKGLNQTVALARAGVKVFHAGAVGSDGLFLLDELRAAGADVSLVSVREDIRTGHAIIQTGPDGDNCILLYGGANRSISPAQIDEALAHFSPGDLLVLQNEISELAYLVEKAAEWGLRIALNPAPMDSSIAALPIETLSWLILNEVEAAQLLGGEGGKLNGPGMVRALHERFPGPAIVLTLGELGAVYIDRKAFYCQSAVPVQAVDTTAAGDTFTGYFLAGILEGQPPAEAMALAAKAAAIAVTRPGASPSIPNRREVEECILKR